MGQFSSWGQTQLGNIVNQCHNLSLSFTLQTQSTFFFFGGVLGASHLRMHSAILQFGYLIETKGVWNKSAWPKMEK